ncbi:stringent starvation protein B [Paucimonas lemoignei]|uniref:Stringent starvation protein B n=1 Tax=Paucimonas lemoignei TaxID=29443 RepID=A0A4R3HVT3_PAULE|nr:ClpXP protease specificity-enhancing factor [Paucimonas lemoignei]TCS37232.1 stringent starvation protein B [Paucimonas lemoignei]
MSETSTKPYLVRAIYEWCTDNGYTPYLAVMVDGRTRVPMQFVKNGEIVLNISFDATSGLKMDNDFIHFSARFGGVSRDIVIPVENVIAIYARENGQGMAFDVVRPSPDEVQAMEGEIDSATRTEPTSLTSVPTPSENKPEGTSPDGNDEPPKKGGRPTLTRIK